MSKLSYQEQILNRVTSITDKFGTTKYSIDEQFEAIKNCFVIQRLEKELDAHLKFTNGIESQWSNHARGEIKFILSKYGIEP